MSKYIRIVIALLILSTLCNGLLAQEPYRVGTTATTFLELGYGSDGVAMGGAYVSNTRGLSSVYWNSAGLAYMNTSEACLSYQPWLVDISSNMFAVAVPSYLGTFAVSAITMDYGEEDVTTVNQPEGTGETFDGSDLALTFSFGRKLAEWFAFGFSTKYIRSQIWHEKAHAVALDLGAIVNTGFFSWTGDPADGLNIGASILNYGTKIAYDGMDLKESVDILPDEDGNYEYVGVKYEVDDWELPLIFKLGISFHPYMTANQDFMIAIDALHPNNNSESVNLGGQYKIDFSSYGSLALRAGYNGLFMDDSVYGLTLGLGLDIRYFGNKKIIVDYAYRQHEYFDGLHSYTIGFNF